MTQRPIKFRAWDTHGGDYKTRYVQMEYFSLFGLDEDYINAYGHFIDDRTIVMQFTGLHDRLGKEIWEGDVVRYVANGEEVIDQVVYIDSFFGVEKYTGTLTTIFPIEVIGNIYENPELLGAKN